MPSNLDSCANDAAQEFEIVIFFTLSLLSFVPFRTAHDAPGVVAYH
jgi:hypothetical protein